MKSWCLCDAAGMENERLQRAASDAGGRGGKGMKKGAARARENDRREGEGK